MMRFLGLVLIAMLFFGSATKLAAQSSPAPTPGSADSAERQKGLVLFAQGKRLEALPLLEESTQKDPNDSEILVALAACLIDHAATLTDQDAAGKERFRARDLVQKAWSLGNTSPLTENLRQILGQLPASGAIKFSDNPAVEALMNSGEAAFARRDFDEALKNYTKALELEPKNYTAALFIGNTYDRKNDFAKAAEWYEHAAALDPNLETAYRYYADMLAKQGDMAKSRAMLIHAAVAEPYNKIVWREIRAWAIINKTEFNIVYVGIPAPRKTDPTYGGKLAPEVAEAWQAYFSVQSQWTKGDRFRQYFPQESEYRHSLPEESEALTAAAHVLEKMKANKKTADALAADATASYLVKLYDAGLVDAYVLFSLGDDGIAKDYMAYRAKNREKLETYMDRFVMPPAPVRP